MICSQREIDRKNFEGDAQPGRFEFCGFYGKTLSIVLINLELEPVVFGACQQIA